MALETCRMGMAIFAASLLGLTVVGRTEAQDVVPQQAETQEPNANGDRERLAAEVEKLKASLREMKQALQDARQEAERERKVAEEARTQAAKRQRADSGNRAKEEKQPIAERLEQAGLEKAAQQAAQFVAKQRQRLMRGGDKDKDEESTHHEKSKRHKKPQDGEKIVSVRLNLDILIVKRPEPKHDKLADHHERHAHDTGQNEQEEEEVEEEQEDVDVVE